MDEKIKCPLCATYVKVKKDGKIARHGHRHGPGVGGGHCAMTNVHVEDMIPVAIKNLRKWIEWSEELKVTDRTRHPSTYDSRIENYRDRIKLLEELQ